MPLAFDNTSVAANHYIFRTIKQQKWLALTCTGGEVRPQGVAAGTRAGEGALSVPAPVGTLGRARFALVNVCTREADDGAQVKISLRRLPSNSAEAIAATSEEDAKTSSTKKSISFNRTQCDVLLGRMAK